MAAVERPGLRVGALSAVRDLPALVRRDPLVRNSLFLMMTIAGRSLLGFAYWIVAARLFPTSTIGLAAAFISAYSLGGMVANPAVHSGLTQELPSTGSGRAWSGLVNGGIVIGAVSSVVIGSLIGAILPVVSSEFSSVTGNALSFVGFVAGVFGMVVGVIIDFTFVAERSSGVMFARSVAFGVGKIPLLFLTMQLVGRHSSTGIWSSWVVADLVTIAVVLLIGLPRLGRDYRIGTPPDMVRWRELVKDLGVHHLTNLGGILPMFVLPIEVVARVSAQANAYFYVTWMLCTLFFMISPSVEFALFTEGSHEPGAIAEMARRSFRITGALLVVPMIGYLLLGRFVLGIYGADYARHGTTLLLVLVASAVPDAITNIYVSVLRVQRRLLESALLNMGMALITLVGAWFLLPSMGITGAGVAWIGAQAAGTAYTALRSRGQVLAPVAA